MTHDTIDWFMAYAIRYATRSGRTNFRFFFDTENGRFQVYVMDGPSFPLDLVGPAEAPPGCESANGGYRIHWFSMAAIVSLGQAQALAAQWAEDIERFLQTECWRIPYRTNDGQDLFEFSIERAGAGLRIYIERHPSYRQRDDSAHATHRLSEGPRRYVCWEGELRSWKDAENLATAWAQKTQEYICTGARF